MKHKETSLQVGLVGAGLQGKRRVQALLAEGDRLLIVADTNLQSAQRLAQEMGCQSTTYWEEVITTPKVNVVLVCTPPYIHAPICIAALKVGKHVLCEKPMGCNLDEALAIAETAKRAGLKLKCGFNHRYHPGIQKLRHWVEAGHIGEIDFIRGRYGIGGREEYNNEWRMNAEMSGGGELMDQGLHLLNLAHWFLGEFSQVFGFLSTRFWNVASIEDNAFALVRTPQGQVAWLHASWTQWKNLFSFEIFGHDGYALVEGLGGSYGTERAILGKRDLSRPFTEEVVEFRGEDYSWREEWKHFKAAIAGRNDDTMEGQEALVVHRLASAIYQSAKTGSLVRL